VEVASENWQDDYGKKRAEYARRGVPVYVVVDWRRRCLVVCREPEEATGRYQQEVTYREGEAVVLGELDGCVLAVSEVLGGAFGEDLLQEDIERLLAERAAREAAEARAKEAEARAEAERAAKEAERRAKLEAEARAEAERAAKEALLAELARLRAQLGSPPEA
ncbi:MAG: Uma2 family endonuclease, partial [Acidobacteriota bacterium]|nr:Uma2 family endonuclease [Acidobacteriota bacterium]